MGSHGQLVHQIPRRADYEVVTKDVGSCAPQFIRVTTNNLPQSKDELVCGLLGCNRCFCSVP